MFAMYSTTHSRMWTTFQENSITIYNTPLSPLKDALCSLFHSLLLLLKKERDEIFSSQGKIFYDGRWQNMFIYWFSSALSLYSSAAFTLPPSLTVLSFHGEEKNLLKVVKSQKCCKRDFLKRLSRCRYFAYHIHTIWGENVRVFISCSLCEQIKTIAFVALCDILSIPFERWKGSECCEAVKRSLLS